MDRGVIRWRRVPVAWAFGLAAVALVPPAAPAQARELSSEWRKMATAADRARLRRWRDAWMQATDKVRAGGQGGALAAQGTLFDPDHALADARPPVGDYRCRMFKLGGRAPGNLDFVAYPAFACRIDAEGDLLSFRKDGGSQRPVGLIFEETRGRAVFLGTMMLGDETRAIDYGRDAARDMAGFVERVDDSRWRIALPWPRFEAMLDVMEMVPA